MDERIKLLMEDSGCDQAEAELALQVTNYNLEKATSALRIILRDIVVIKGKFFIESEIYYGLFIIIVNKRAKNIVRLRCAISYNPKLYEVNLNTDWHLIEKTIHIYRLQEGSILSFANIIESYFQQKFTEDENNFFDAANKMDSGAIENILNENPPKTMSSVQIMLEEINLEELNPVDSEETPKKNVSKLSLKDFKLAPGDMTRLLLEVKLREDKTGIMAYNLSRGDLILAQITDTRDIAEYMTRLLGTIEQDYLPVKIEKINRRDRLIEFTLHLASDVYGAASVYPNARIKVIKKVSVSWWRKISLTFYKIFGNKNTAE